MIIQLKKWQEDMARDLLAALPGSIKKPLEASVHMLAYIDKQTGDGFYKDNVAYISRGIRHPRLFAERVCHEWGHGIEDWLSANGYSIYSESPERLADGFALVVLYPEIFRESGWRTIRNIYTKAFFQKGLPKTGLESLIQKYIQIVRQLNAMGKTTMGTAVHDRLEEFFRAQSDGFLRINGKSFGEVDTGS